MVKKLIDGKLLEVGMFPYFARQLGFRDADEITRIAQRFGKIVTPMRYDDVIEWFEDLKR